MLTIYEVRDAIKSLIAPLIRKTTLGGSTADGKGDRSRGYERGPGDPDYGFPVRRMQHYGFTSWIPVESEIVSLAVGGATNGTRVCIASETPGAAPTLEKEGESVLFNSKADGGTSYQLFKANGYLILVPTSSGKVQLGSADAAACDAVVTLAELQAKVNALQLQLDNHTHVVAGALAKAVDNAGVPVATPLGHLTCAGSPNVTAKKP